MTNLHFHRSIPSRAWRSALLWALVGILLTAGIAPVALAGDAKEPSAQPAEMPGEGGSPHTSGVHNGVLETKDGLTLRLTTDLGSVKITQLEPGAAAVVRYTVNIETDARGSTALELIKNYSLKARATYTGVEITGSLPPQTAHSSNAQFWVQYEVAVPRNYNVEVSTEAGDITTGDIGGTASLQTQGGNITAGRIGVAGLREVWRGRPVAKLETEGGQIQVLDVAGDLTAFTAGGHISAGNIAGDASLHSGGGHIRAGQIGGRAELDTAGGNITVAQARNFVSVHTGGGQIDFGEVRGSVRAQTGGGGIRVMYVSGPMEVESNAGSICLTRVADAVQASTSGGTITAWINPDAAGSGPVRLGGASQLASGSGDIIVFLPRNLAATIDAIVTNGTEHQIEADSALKLNIQAPPNGSGPVHAVATLLGGGPLLKLRTAGGKIQLKYLDSEVAYRTSLVREQVERVNRKLSESGIPQVDFPRETYLPGTGKAEDQSSQESAKTDWLDSWLNSLEQAFRGGISESQDDFFKRLTYHPAPSYPALAQRAGIHGRVVLQARITTDGHVEVQKVLEGEPVLVDAAIDAVKKWQAKPAWINGKKVAVISKVTFDFQLR
jgi:TonB family protein